MFHLHQARASAGRGRVGEEGARPPRFKEAYKEAKLLRAKIKKRILDVLERSLERAPSQNLKVSS